MTTRLIGGRKVRAPKSKSIRDSEQAERFEQRATENTPPNHALRGGKVEIVFRHKIGIPTSQDRRDGKSARVR